MAGERPAGGRPVHVHPAASPHRSSLSRLRPTGRGVAATAIILLLLVLEETTRTSGLVLFVVVLVIPLAAAPLLALSRAHRARWATVRIMVVPPVVPVDGSCELIVQLSNEGDTALPVLYLDGPAEHSRPEVDRPRGRVAPAPTRSSAALAGSPGRLLRWEALGAHQNSAVVLNASTRRRGVFAIGPLRLWACDPFGLFGVPVAEAAPVRVVVHPPVAPSAAAHLRPVTPAPSAVPAAGEARFHSDDPAGEWNGLRPYVPGDRLHLLSWPAEALYGSLLVQEFSSDGTDRIRLVLDDRAGVHRRRAFEAALSTVHGLLVDAAQEGFEVELVALSGDQSVGSSSLEGMVDHLTFLARARPRPGSARARWAVPDPVLVGASVVVTTSTAHPTLPRLPGNPSVVVVG